MGWDMTAQRDGLGDETVTDSAAPPKSGSLLMPAQVLRTQTVTAGDIEKGGIRVPGDSKRLFPRDQARISVELLGELFSECLWNPKFGPDKARSGRISIPQADLQRLLRPRGPLRITRIEGGVRLS